jgi:hypothetical protein
MSVNVQNLNTTKSISISFLYCHYCAKKYKTRNSLEKHTILCEIIYKSNNRNNSKLRSDDEQEDELPSQKRLYQMLLELGCKYNRLEEKVNEMNKYIVKKKKKINVLEWLNMNVKPECVFDNLHEQINVSDEDIKYLFENSFMDMLNILFSKTIYVDDETNKVIFAFVQKSGLFYIYEKMHEKNEWIQLSRDKLILFLNRCHKKIFRALIEWKKSNLSKIMEDDKCAMEYDKTNAKLMSVDFKQENTLNKVKTMMYNQMKTDMKNLIEYEFE